MIRDVATFGCAHLSCGFGIQQGFGLLPTVRRFLQPPYASPLREQVLDAEAGCTIQANWLPPPAFDRSCALPSHHREKERFGWVHAPREYGQAHGKYRYS